MNLAVVLYEIASIKSLFTNVPKKILGSHWQYHCSMINLPFAGIAGSLPPLVPDQVLKLKQLTVLTLAETSKVLMYLAFLLLYLLLVAMVS